MLHRSSTRPAGTIAVALHDVEPATFERCARIRDWLDDHGVDRVTLLVIPARDLHPLGERSPEMTQWLTECRAHGDSIAQHGFQHERLRQVDWTQRLRAPASGHRRAAEFVGLDGPETRRAVEAGWRVLKLAGVEPDGFVAPAYAYTRALRSTLTTEGKLSVRFRWWASLLRLHVSFGGHLDMAPALSPSLIRAGSLLQGRNLRLDVHPADLDRPRHMLALERVLSRAGGRRTAITYDELAARL
ncbi:MAG TPA: DUF2334 domain-containing protein [Solirubrobacteraceae bacterium]|jgi:predicted deacetylase